MSSKNCTACGGIAMQCLACESPMDDCECGADAEPSPCEHCNGTGWEPLDPYAGDTAQISDLVIWTDAAGCEWDNLEVLRVDAKAKALTCRGWFGQVNKSGRETIKTLRLPMGGCTVSRRVS